MFSVLRYLSIFLVLTAVQISWCDFLLPVNVTSDSFDEDIIANSGQTALASTTEGVGNAVLFENGFQSNNDGLPVGGNFVSANNSDITYQLQSYSANNAMMLTAASQTGTLTLQTPGRYSSLSLIGFCGFGDHGATVTLNFSDASSQEAAWSVTDWWNGAGSKPDAYTFARVDNRNNNGPISSTIFSMYELEIAVEEANQSKLLESVTLSNTSLSGDESVNVFAMSGTSAVPEPVTVGFLACGLGLLMAVRRRK